jgi:hypothetical protein
LPAGDVADLPTFDNLVIVIAEILADAASLLVVGHIQSYSER